MTHESSAGVFGSFAPFLGTYTPRLDEKGRLILPAKFRGQLAPGLVMTRMTEEALEKLSPEQGAKLKSAYPLGVGQPEDVARAAVFLLGPGSAWTTGVDLPVDGGYTAQ